MIKNKFLWCVTVLVALLQAAVLCWHYFNPKIVFIGVLDAPYLLDVPSWFSLVVMPIFSLCCLLLMRKRLQSTTVNRGKATTYALIGFVFSFNYGATLAGSYYWAMELYTVMLIIGIAVIACIVKSYRAECVFGFALSLSFVIGALQALELALVTASVCWLLYKCRKLPLHFARDNSFT